MILDGYLVKNTDTGATQKVCPDCAKKTLSHEMIDAHGIVMMMPKQEDFETEGEWRSEVDLMLNCERCGNRIPESNSGSLPLD